MRTNHTRRASAALLLSLATVLSACSANTPENRMLNSVHQPIVEPLLERHDSRRISGEGPLGEGIDLKEGSGRQEACSVISCGRRVSLSN